MGKTRGGLLVGIGLLTAVFYGSALRFDLQCDDLLVIRPWSRAELFAVWHGTWEPTHAFATFFRPIATWFYAGAFQLFGLNATAHMILSIAMLAAVTGLLALFVVRETGRTSDGIAVAFAYLLHPNTPWSTGVWITNDFHKLTAIAALSGLLVWQRLCGRDSSRWWLLAPFAVFCFLVKEDGIMLIPVFLSLQWARARIVGDVKTPGLATVGGAALLGAALMTWRYLALRELGGFGIPPMSAIFPNLARGPIYAFTMHGSLSVLTPLEKCAALAAIGILTAGIWLMPRPQRFLPIAGLIIMFWYDLPLALISNVMRYYMLTIASVMVVVPVFLALHTRDAQERRWPVYVGGLVLLFFAVQARSEFRELKLFAPCQRLEHECVPWVLEDVNTLPPEARSHVSDTARACLVDPVGRPRIGDRGTLTWGLGSTSIDTMTGARSSAVAGDVVTLIRGDAPSASLVFRHQDATPDHRVQVEITADGKRSTRELTTPDWVRMDVPLTAGLRSWLRDAHRVDAKFSAPGAEWKLVGEAQK